VCSTDLTVSAENETFKQPVSLIVDGEEATPIIVPILIYDSNLMKHGFDVGVYANTDTLLPALFAITPLSYSGVRLQGFSFMPGSSIQDDSDFVLLADITHGIE